MSFFDFFWLSEKRALEYGFTNHGRLYGMPAWVRDDGDEVIACPKVGLFQFAAIAIDCFFEFFSWFLPSDASVNTPLSIGEPISCGDVQ